MKLLAFTVAAALTLPNTSVAFAAATKAPAPTKAAPAASQTPAPTPAINYEDMASMLYVIDYDGLIAANIINQATADKMKQFTLDKVKSDFQARQKLIDEARNNPNGTVSGSPAPDIRIRDNTAVEPGVPARQVTPPGNIAQSGQQDTIVRRVQGDPQGNAFPGGPRGPGAQGLPSGGQPGAFVTFNSGTNAALYAEMVTKKILTQKEADKINAYEFAKSEKAIRDRVERYITEKLIDKTTADKLLVALLEQLDNSRSGTSRTFITRGVPGGRSFGVYDEFIQKKILTEEQAQKLMDFDFNNAKSSQAAPPSAPPTQKSN